MTPGTTPGQAAARPGPPRPEDLVVTGWQARFRGRVMPCAVGRGGIGRKRGEGDGITPRGIWPLGPVLFRPDRIAPPRTLLPVLPIGPGDLWSDDPRDPAYNHLVRRQPGRAFTAEALRRPDPLYDLVAVTGFNWPEAVPGAGSAIFLHVWRAPRRPTEGCVAFRRPDLLFILENWTARSRLVVR